MHFSVITHILFLLSSCPCEQGEKNWHDIVQISPSIFIGKVKTKFKIDKTLIMPDKTLVEFEEVEFQVENYLKKDLLEEQTIRIINEIGSCATTLDIGETYLVAPYQTAVFSLPRVHPCFKQPISIFDPSFKKEIETIKNLVKE